MISDTTPDIQARYQAMLLALSPEQRIKAASQMFSAARTLALAGLTDEPNPEDLSQRVRLFLRFYAEDFPEPHLSQIIARLKALPDLDG